MHRSRIAPVDALAPIGLSELDACAALRERVDVKYIAGLDVLAALTERLAPTHRALEIDGRRSFAYASTYFDTPRLGAYRAHLQGRRRRFKTRVRRYADGPARVLEVKARAARGATVKRRLALPGPAPAPLAGAPLAFVCDAAGRPLHSPLAPALQVRYERITLVAPARGERLTCDIGLAFAAPEEDGTRARLAGGAVVIESKSRTGRALADDVLRELGIRPVEGCSKYCLGIALTRPGVTANPYRRVLRRHFEEAP